MGIPPGEFLLYYAGGVLVVIGVLFWRRPRRGMRLRLGAGRRTADYKSAHLRGRIPPDIAAAMSAVGREGERSINVVFNYNGHSWDAYEVLGLPAGSGMAVVEAAYQESIDRVDAASRPFLREAFKAIEHNFLNRKSG